MVETTKMTSGVHSLSRGSIGSFLERRAFATLTMQAGRWAAKKVKRMMGTQSSFRVTSPISDL